jgi:hypothetical protein
MADTQFTYSVVYFDNLDNFNIFLKLKPFGLLPYLEDDDRIEPRTVATLALAVRQILSIRSSSNMEIGDPLMGR